MITKLELVKLIETEFENMMIIETSNGTFFGGPDGMDAFELYDNKIKVFLGSNSNIIHDLSNLSKRDIVKLLEEKYFSRYDFSKNLNIIENFLDYYYNLKFIDYKCYTPKESIEIVKGGVILNQGEKVFNITKDTLFIDIEIFLRENKVIESNYN